MTTYHATKYDSAAHEVISILASVSEGYGSEETGDVESPVGFLALVHLDDSCDLDVTDTTGAYPIGDEAGETAREYGVTADDIRGHHLVTHNSQGFVYVESFATREEAANEFACRAARFEFWADEDRDEDGDGVYVCPVTGHGYHSL